MITDYNLELNLKREMMRNICEHGQILVQDGQLSSMEVESRLGEIKTGLQQFELALKKTEEILVLNTEMILKIANIHRRNLQPI